MNYFLDWFLIIICTFFTIKAYKKICFEKNCSISNIIICIIFVFCVLPILFNYIYGIPNYDTVYWYKVFIGPMNNEKVSIIYDIYIFVSMLMLHLYAKKYKPKEASFNKFLFINTTYLSKIIIILPYIYIILTGTISNYLTYNTSSHRGFEIVNTSYFTTLMALIFLSLFTYYSNFFKKDKRNKISYLLFFIYNISIIWIVGKRFIIANIILTIIYYLSQSEISEKMRKKMYKYTPIILSIFLAFSGFYLIAIRPLSDTSTSSVYEMLRVDFGRDDVIKYTIDQEIIKNNRILDYRGETFISTLLPFIPRQIWPSKPYPHYMYLTASILNLSIFKLPAGTTPSWYEMCISNFGILGMVIACFGIVLLCKLADSSKDADIKYVWFLLIVVLLTQSIDIYIIYILVLTILLLLILLRKLRKDFAK